MLARHQRLQGLQDDVRNVALERKLLQVRGPRDVEEIARALHGIVHTRR